MKKIQHARFCTEPGCGNLLYSKGICRNHYANPNSRFENWKQDYMDYLNFMRLDVLPWEKIEQENDRNSVMEVLEKTLSGRGLEILIMRYGLRGRIHNPTEIGIKFRVSGSRVSQLEKKALDKLFYPMLCKKYKDEKGDLMRIYYAHNKKTYGTARERRELAFLRRSGEVLDPNTDIGEMYSSEPYFRAIDTCSAVAVSGENGYISRGCFEEVRYALSVGKPVWYIKSGWWSHTLLPVVDARVTNPQSWRRNYAVLVLGKKPQRRVS